jgi:hypothetical protein
MLAKRESEFIISDLPMVNNAFETPVALIMFNRPEHTKKVLEKIREVRPRKLYVIADGPRANKQMDPELVLACRRLIDEIDWDCDVVRDFSEINLGCRERVVSGLSNVFSHEDRAIILEDDCLPSKSFFYFTQSLLDRFADDSRIGSIGGTLPTDIEAPGHESYFFSKYPQIWGWGTWSRVWKTYDAAIATWPTLRNTSFLERNLHSKKAIANWRWNFDRIYKNKIDTWDYQFVFNMWTHNLLTVIPSTNLVSNIGFGPDATHTYDTSSKFSNIVSKEMQFPLVRPESVSETSVDTVMDRLLFNGSLLEAKIAAMLSNSPKWVKLTLLKMRNWARKLLAFRK